MALHPLSRLMSKEKRWRTERRKRSPHDLVAPQMMSPIITARTASSITRMHIFFRDFRCRDKKQKKKFLSFYNSNLIVEKGQSCGYNAS